MATMVVPSMVVCPESNTHVVGGWSPLPPSRTCTGLHAPLGAALGVVLGATDDDVVGDSVVGEADGVDVHGRFVHTGYWLYAQPRSSQPRSHSSSSMP